MFACDVRSRTDGTPTDLRLLIRRGHVYLQGKSGRQVQCRRWCEAFRTVCAIELQVLSGVVGGGKEATLS